MSLAARLFDDLSESWGGDGDGDGASAAQFAGVEPAASETNARGGSSVPPSPPATDHNDDQPPPTSSVSARTTPTLQQ